METRGLIYWSGGVWMDFYSEGKITLNIEPLSTFITMISYSKQGCNNNLLRLGSINSINESPIVLEAGKSRLKMAADPVSKQALFLTDGASSYSRRSKEGTRADSPPPQDHF